MNRICRLNRNLFIIIKILSVFRNYKLKNKLNQSLWEVFYSLRARSGKYGCALEIKFLKRSKSPGPAIWFLLPPPWEGGYDKYVIQFVTPDVELWNFTSVHVFVYNDIYQYSAFWHFSTDWSKTYNYYFVTVFSNRSHWYFQF